MILALMSRGAVALGAFGLVTAGVVALTYQLTSEQIERNEKAVAIAAVQTVLPAHDNDLLAEQMTLPADLQLGWDEPFVVTLAKQNNQLVGLAVPVRARDGYSGPIDMVLGIDPAGTITGLRVVKHKETPGLGDKIDLAKSDWILDFNGTSLAAPERDQWAPKPDGGAFDAFTGATITPRAVIAATARALTWFEQSGQAAVMGESNE